MTRSPMPHRFGLGFAVCIGAVLLASCAGNDKPGAAPSNAPSAPSAGAQAPSNHTVPPTPQTQQDDEALQPTASGPATSQQATSADSAPSDGSCGTVTAANGMTLQVLNETNTNTDCGESMRVVQRFHDTIAAQQSAAPDRPVSATVDGWSCVAGPQAAQGGTTCSRDEQTILAALVPAE